MPREKVDDKQKGKLKRMRRARGGRTLPRSGGGAHEDKKCKKLEKELVAEAEDEIRNWKQHEEDADDIAHELLSERDMLDADCLEEWDEDEEMDYYKWKYGERE